MIWVCNQKLVVDVNLFLICLCACDGADGTCSLVLARHYALDRSHLDYQELTRGHWRARKGFASSLSVTCLVAVWFGCFLLRAA